MTAARRHANPWLDRLRALRARSGLRSGRPDRGRWTAGGKRSPTPATHRIPSSGDHRRDARRSRSGPRRRRAGPRPVRLRPRLLPPSRQHPPTRVGLRPISPGSSTAPTSPRSPRPSTAPPPTNRPADTPFANLAAFVDHLRTVLGDTVFKQHATTGAAMELAEVVAYAHHHIRPPAQNPPPPPERSHEPSAGSDPPVHTTKLPSPRSCSRPAHNPRERHSIAALPNGARDRPGDHANCSAVSARERRSERDHGQSGWSLDCAGELRSMATSWE